MCLKAEVRVRAVIVTDRFGLEARNRSKSVWLIMERK